MRDADWGDRDAKGDWLPPSLPKPSPLFRLPWKPRDILRYLFAPGGFLWPVNLVYALVALGCWLLLTPGPERTARLQWDWIALLYLRNAAILTVVAGGLHLRLYTTRGQGSRFKYSNRWPAARDERFLFGNQTRDNVFWSLTAGCATWTGYEALTLWAYARGWLPYVSFREHPVYSVLLMVGVLYLRYLHFYATHRLIHWKPLYRLCHYLHHRNVHPGPWSGLAMHPLEHLIYFSGVLLHWVIPSHPLHAIFHLTHAAISPPLGHAGFHKLVTRDEEGLKTEYYFHYLHHRYFTVNFGSEAVPLDRWFGSFHDGSPESHRRMLARRGGHRAGG